MRLMRLAEMELVEELPHRLCEKNTHCKTRNVFVNVREQQQHSIGLEHYCTTYGFPPAIPPGNAIPFVRTCPCGSNGIGGRP